MRALLLLIPLTLAACGFQLRGQYALPGDLNPLAVTANGVSGPVLLDLTAGIQRMGTTVSADAPLVVRVNYETVNRQTSTLDSRSRAAENTLLYELSWQLVHASGVPAQPERVLRLRRNYQFDNTRIVGKYEEENLLIDDLRQQAVAQILAQLARTDVSTLAPDAAPAAKPAAGATAPTSPR